LPDQRVDHVVERQHADELATVADYGRRHTPIRRICSSAAAIESPARASMTPQMARTRSSGAHGSGAT
jgi:hypothetical protein